MSFHIFAKKEERKEKHNISEFLKKLMDKTNTYKRLRKNKELKVYLETEKAFTGTELKEFISKCPDKIDKKILLEDLELN